MSYFGSESPSGWAASVVGGLATVTSWAYSGLSWPTRHRQTDNSAFDNPSDGSLGFLSASASASLAADAASSLRQRPTAAPTAIPVSDSRPRSFSPALAVPLHSASSRRSSGATHASAAARFVLRWAGRAVAVAAIYAAAMYFLQDKLIYMRRTYDGREATYYRQVRTRGVVLPESLGRARSVTPAARAAAIALAAAAPNLAPLYPTSPAALPLLPVPALPAAERAAAAAAGAAAPLPPAHALGNATIFFVVPPPLTPDEAATAAGGSPGAASGTNAGDAAVGGAWNPLQGHFPSDFYTRPHAIVMLFGGNAQTALDWPFFVHGIYRSRAHAPASNELSSQRNAARAAAARMRLAFLLVDYPGYGLSAGAPSPATVRAAALDVLDTFLLLTGGSRAQASVIVAGHSLGAAAALATAAALEPTRARTAAAGTDGVAVDTAAAAEPAPGADAVALSPVRGALLLSPFTSMLAMARAVAGPLPLLSYLLAHPYDNVRALAAIATARGTDKTTAALPVRVLHGDADEIVPVAQARELVTPYTGNYMGGVALRYTEVAGATHNNLIERAAREVLEAVEELFAAAAGGHNKQ